MRELLITISYILPAVIVFLTAWYILKAFFKQETISRQLKLKEEKQRISLPVRLQAYERVVLFLERISPANLVMRVHKSGLNVKQFQQLLIQNIRDEFDHNLSQQLYMTIDAWEKIRAAKEEMIRQINLSAAALPDEATAADLSQKLLGMSLEKSATKHALDFVKKEAGKII
jgi:hypothetical protein